MPFTLCHPAIVIALYRCARRHTSLPALVIGSMAPDFVYFFSFGVSGSFSHSLPGILIYCLPAGAFVYAIYYSLLRDPFLAWAPPAISARMDWKVEWKWRSTREAWVVLASLALGAASHIAWDAFTHANTLPVNHFDLLRSTISVDRYEVPLFKVLQHVSTLVGFVVITAYALGWYSGSTPAEPFPASLSVKQRLAVLAAVAAASAAGAVSGLLLRRAFSIEHGLFIAVVSGMATAALAIVLLCVGWHLSACRRTKKN